MVAGPFSSNQVIKNAIQTSQLTQNNITQQAYNRHWQNNKTTKQQKKTNKTKWKKKQKTHQKLLHQHLAIFNMPVIDLEHS